MKLGPLVYENKWKSKSHMFPFNGTISLKLGSLYKKKLKRLKMKIWPHFHSKKAFSYSRFCKRNIFLMHGFGNMNFLSFPTLLGKGRFCPKVHFNCNILQNKVCIGYNDGSGQLLTFMQNFSIWTQQHWVFLFLVTKFLYLSKMDM